MGLKIVEVLAFEPKTQVAGVTIICDGKGYGMKQFAGMSVADVKLMMMSMEVTTEFGYTANSRLCGQLPSRRICSRSEKDWRRRICQACFDPACADSQSARTPVTLPRSETMQ